MITEYIEGVGMNELDDEKRAVVSEELEDCIKKLHKIKSDTWGGPEGAVS